MGCTIEIFISARASLHEDLYAFAIKLTIIIMTQCNSYTSLRTIMLKRCISIRHLYNLKTINRSYPVWRMTPLARHWRHSMTSRGIPRSRDVLMTSRSWVRCCRSPLRGGPMTQNQVRPWPSPRGTTYSSQTRDLPFLSIISAETS